jgi:DNA repair protein RadC
MSESTRIDELIRILLPTEALPKHLRPSHLLDDVVQPPNCIEEKVLALRQLIATGGRCEPLTGRIVSSRDVAEFFRPRLRAQQTESIWIAGLDAKNRVLITWCVSRGGTTGAALEPKDALRPLLLNNCTALVLIHNHPSGDPSPSGPDVSVTQRLHRAAEVVGITLLDHVIIGADGHFSFLDAGLMPR